VLKLRLRCWPLWRAEGLQRQEGQPLLQRSPWQVGDGHPALRLPLPETVVQNCKAGPVSLRRSGVQHIVGRVVGECLARCSSSGEQPGQSRRASDALLAIQRGVS